jgi:UDP-N-acetyl-2-amino-2-deoxyglucuronate dehydrogenase
MKKWGFGLIGCGAIADIHLQAIAEIEHAHIVGVASRNEGRARETAERFNCAWTTDYHELLQRPDIDFVCVTTSSGTHGSIGMEVLKMGKHLIVEKPIAMTSHEADAMIQLAKQKNLVLSVVSQNRFLEHHQLIKEVLLESRLGKLLLVEISRPYYRDQQYYDSADWRGTIANDGGALMNQGIHSIDILLWLAGGVSSVIGRVATQTHRMEAEDIGLALLTFQSGAFASIMCSTSMVPGFSPTLHLYGEKGSIKVDGSRISHWSVPGMDPPEHLLQSATVRSSASDPRNVSHTEHKLQILDVMAAAQESRVPAVTGEAGRDAVRLIELIYQSSASDGKTINMS